MTGTPKRLARLALAVVLVVPPVLVGASATSVAAPTKAEVEAAQAELQRVNQELELAIEQYNDARARGYGGKDFSAMVDALCEHANIEKPRL